MKEIEFISFYNNKFKMEGCYYNDYLTVLAPGYIIRPDGLCVIVPYILYHAYIICIYINKFLEKKYQLYQSTDAIQVLTDKTMNCVVYNGMRIRELISKQRQFKDEGCGILFLPQNEELTDKQKLACQAILQSNKSLFGGREKIDLKIGYISGVEISKNDFQFMLQNNGKKK